MLLGGSVRLSRDSLLKSGWRSTLPCPTKILPKIQAAIVWRSCSIAPTICLTIWGRSCWLTADTDAFWSGLCHRLNFESAFTWQRVGLPGILDGKTCLVRGANSYDNGRSSSQSTYSRRSAKNQEPSIFTRVSEYRREATIKRFFPLSTVT